MQFFSSFFKALKLLNICILFPHLYFSRDSFNCCIVFKLPPRYDVIIVGGGIVGAGIARDLQYRGAQVALFEKNDFATGATGRSHALLHSGGRYVVKDPESARECAVENKVLKRIAKHIVEDTGGLFVAFDGYDPEDYPKKFYRGCKDTGVVCRELTPREALELEPNLNHNIREAYWVNDGHIDPFRLTYLNLLDAMEAGATIENYHEVTEFLVENNEVIGVKVFDKFKGETFEVYGDATIIASGAWGDKLLSKLNLSLGITPNRGAIIVYGRRVFNAVINRLRPPSDGDIVVPSFGTSLLGTTSIDAKNPEDYEPSREEIKKLEAEGKVLSKVLFKTRIFKVFSGSRPLISSGGREATRTFKIFDLGDRGFENLYVIGGGKLTTYRLMAEKMGNVIAEKLGLSKESKTSKNPLPGYYDPIELERLEKKYPELKLSIRRSYSKWGNIAKNFYSEKRNDIVCLCEQVTAKEILFAIEKLKAKTIPDVMRRTRATMGPCQGQNCILRIASILLENQQDYEKILTEDIIRTLRTKWKRYLPVINNNQQTQFELHKAVYRLTLNLDKIARKGDQK